MIRRFCRLCKGGHYAADHEYQEVAIVPMLSPDDFRFDTLPEDEETCSVCGTPVSYECPCDAHFADPDDFWEAA